MFKPPVVDLKMSRSFGILIGAFGFLGGVALPFYRGQTIHILSTSVGLVGLLLGLLAPKILMPLTRAWFMFGYLMGRIVSPVALGIFFYLILTPFALVSRICGFKFIPMKYAPKQPSYWEDRKPPGPAGESLSHQF